MTSPRYIPLVRNGDSNGGSRTMVTREDIQSWLDRLEGGNLEVSEMQPGMWIARTPEGAEVVVSLA